ncbi:MAG: hypothetical protein HY320_08535 [Armatimonadetes bacterium]|nr:hypothetical protein [Armatimonadota bacterium]
MSQPALNLDAALEAFGRELPGRRTAKERRAGGMAVAVLREFLVDYAGLGAAEELRAADVQELMLDSILRDPDATPAAAAELAATLAQFAVWAARQPGFCVADEVPPLIERLRDDVPRVLTAASALQAGLVGEGETGGAIEITDEKGIVLGSLAAGVGRILRPRTIDYRRSEEDWFLVERIEGDQLTLQSVTGGYLGEGARGPVPVPAEAAEALRPGDVLLAEIAPAGDGWELINLVAAYPGGYGWPPRARQDSK